MAHKQITTVRLERRPHRGREAALTSGLYLFNRREPAEDVCSKQMKKKRYNRPRRSNHDSNSRSIRPGFHP